MLLTFPDRAAKTADLRGPRKLGGGRSRSWGGPLRDMRRIGTRQARARTAGKKPCMENWHAARSRAAKVRSRRSPIWARKPETDRRRVSLFTREMAQSPATLLPPTTPFGAARRRICVLSEDLSGAPDEGIKKFALALASALGRVHDVELIGTRGADVPLHARLAR